MGERFHHPIRCSNATKILTVHVGMQQRTNAQRTHARAADLDLDGAPDLVSVNETSGDVAVHVGLLFD